jgi:uncharacterized membrane protein
MTADLAQQSPLDPLPAKRPRNVLAGLYGHPVHPALVTVPIGAWVASLVFDIASYPAKDEYVYTRGAYWLIGLGVVGAVVAAVFGLIDWSTIPPRTVARRIGLQHLVLNVALIAAFTVSFFVRQSQDVAEPTAPGLIALSAVALVVLGVSGWLGAALAYRYGVRVADERTQAEGLAPAGD